MIIIKRIDNNLHTTLPISISEAIFGAEKEVVMPNQTIKKIEIPPGSQPGDFIKISGAGTANLQTKQKGDFVIELMLEIPKGVPNQILIKDLENFEQEYETPYRKSYDDLIEIYRNETGATRKTLKQPTS